MKRLLPLMVLLMTVAEGRAQGALSLNSYVSGLPAAGNLTGTESLYCVQGGLSVRCLTSQLISLTCGTLPGTCTSVFGYANPVWWGADPTGAADSLAAFNSAKAASNAVLVPPGKFKLSAALSYSIPSGINSVTLNGSGKDVTILTFPNSAGGVVFTYGDVVNNSVHMANMSLTTGQAGTANCVWLSTASTTANPANTAFNDVQNVGCYGADGYGGPADYWSVGFEGNGVSNIYLHNVTYTGKGGASFGTVGQCFSFAGLPASTSYAVVVNIQASTCNQASAGFVYGSYLQGVVINQSNFTGLQNCWDVPASGTGALSQFTISNSQCATSSAGLLQQTYVNPVTVIGNVIEVGGNGGTGIFLGEYYDFEIVGNNISNFNASTGTVGISVQHANFSSGGTIIGNGLDGLATGIQLAAAAQKVSVIGNMIDGTVTTPIQNLGSTNQVLNNPGWNPVGPLGITVGASPYTYTATGSPETIYIFGGTVSSVQFGAGLTTVACNATPCTVDLGPNEQVKVTYSSVPTMNKMVH
jgi:hypothetical protein